MQKFLITFISIFSLLLVVKPLFVDFIPGTADGLAHKFRLAAFDKALNEGYWRPRWLGDLALGFGAPLLMFVYNLPYYAVESIHRVGFSVNLSTQIFEAGTIILSFMSMFLLGRKLWGNLAGLTAGTVYTWAPYHLMTVYLYEGWGEMGGFVFPPLILYLIIRILDKLKVNPNIFVIPTKPRLWRGTWRNLSTCLSGARIRQLAEQEIPRLSPVARDDKLILDFILLIIFWFLFLLTHNISVMIFSPVLLFLSLGLSWQRIKTFLIVLTAFFTAFLLSSFYTLPAMFQNGQISYHRLIENAVIHRVEFYKPISELVGKSFSMITESQAHYLDFSLGIPILFVTVWSVLFLFIHYFPISLFGQRNGRKERPAWCRFLDFSNLGHSGGSSAIAAVSARLPLDKKNYQKSAKAIQIIIFLLLVSLFLISPLSSFVWNMGILNWIVYPFRFLLLTVFCGSLLAGYLARKYIFLAGVFLVLAVISGRAYTHPYVEIFPWDEEYFRQPQTISSAPGTKKSMAVGEFLPKGANIEFLLEKEKEYIGNKKPFDKFILEDKSGRILESEAKSEDLWAKVEMVKKGDLMINTFSFPNWEAKIDGKFTDIEIDSTGRMKIFINEGIHTVRFHFGVSGVEKAGILLSTLGIAIFILGIFLLKSIKIDKLQHTRNSILLK